MPFMRAKETMTALNPFQNGLVECREIINEASGVASRIEKLIELARKINDAVGEGKSISADENEMLLATSEQINQLMKISQVNLILIHDVIEGLKRLIEKNNILKERAEKTKVTLKKSIKDLSDQIKKQKEGNLKLEEARKNIESQVSYLENMIKRLNELTRSCKAKLDDLHRRLRKTGVDFLEVSREARRANR